MKRKLETVESKEERACKLPRVMQQHQIHRHTFPASCDICRSWLSVSEENLSFTRLLERQEGYLSTLDATDVVPASSEAKEEIESKENRLGLEAKLRQELQECERQY